MGARSVVLAGILFGVGLGGFFDGIVFHQLLQWHHLVSEVVPPTTVAGIRSNTTADGLFHLAAWAVTVVAVAMLWRARGDPGARPGSLLGAILVGWGAFNVVEGIVDHHVLGLHHVRPGPGQFAWDLAFLAWGALMILAGVALLRRSRPGVSPRGTPGRATGSGGRRSRAWR